MSVRPPTPEGLKPKDLIGVPWRIASALQDAGWWIRSEVIWVKPNAHPESVDRIALRWIMKRFSYYQRTKITITTWRPFEGRMGGGYEPHG